MNTSPRSSTSSDSRSGTLRLDFIRDPGFCGDWLNRYCQNADTNEVLYHCDVASDDHQLEIRRGNKYGPVIAKSSRCLSSPGATDILLTERNARTRHVHYDENRAKAYFTEDGHNYHWNSNLELLDDQTGGVVAYMSVAKNAEARRSGELVIKEEGYALRDPIVMSALLVQERFDEANSCF